MVMVDGSAGLNSINDVEAVESIHAEGVVVTVADWGQKQGLQCRSKLVEFLENKEADSERLFGHAFNDNQEVQDYESKGDIPERVFLCPISVNWSPNLSDVHDLQKEVRMMISLF